MKNLLILFFLIVCFQPSFTQDDIDWRIIPSLTEWIEEINNSADSVYVAKDIKIMIDFKKDSLIAYTNRDRKKHEGKPKEIVLSVNKPVRLDRWYIETGFGTPQMTVIQNIRFEKEVYLRDMKMYGFAFKNVIFEGELMFNGQTRQSWFRFNDCEFRKHVSFNNINEFSWIFLEDCLLDEMFYTFQVTSEPIIGFENTTVKGELFLAFTKLKQFTIDSCKVETLLLENAEVSTAAYLFNSSVNNIDLEGALLPENNTYMPFDQISKKVMLYNTTRVNDSIVTTKYQAHTNEDFEDKKSYDLLIASYKLLLNGYQNRGDMVSYNACYLEMRDKETAYFKYVLGQKPSFDNFLTYQLNVFLRAFSDYGTKPTKAISFSIYVILFFALIYLFFPNSWDSHGRKRIMDRYTFFLKYIDRKAGIHEVYLDEKKEDLMEFDEFKSFVESKKGRVPKIFITTGLPLYKWAISGTKLTSGVLKGVDVMQGTWAEVPKSQRWWKWLLLIGAFTIAILYDLIIKMLNALMLSINTFTTLGFGEIPIKGLPRYLAIIQGFIGWFMLTIFSVSLISQLLN